jgi:hypothetical protein
MFWSDAAWILVFLTLIGNNPFPLERAAQIAVFGLMIDASKGHWLHGAIKAPLLWFVICGLIFEVLHLLHQRKTKAMRNTWLHLERLRGHQDLSTLLKLMLEQNQMVQGKHFVK